jgi:hypothetical protein
LTQRPQLENGPDWQAVLNVSAACGHMSGLIARQRPERPADRRHRDTIILEITKANPRQIGGDRRFADAADARQSTQWQPRLTAAAWK